MADSVTPGVKKTKRRFAPVKKAVKAEVVVKKEPNSEAERSFSGEGESSTAETPKTTLGTIRPETPGAGRLPSINDASKTKGGAPKMKFKPTVPLKRNKKEVVTSSIDDALSNKQSNERGRGRGRGGRGRGRGRGLIIEESTASGIFSLGPSMISRGKGGYSGGGGFVSLGGDVNQREEGDSSKSDMVEMFTSALKNDTPVTFKHVSRLAGDVDPVTLSQPKKTIPWMRVKSDKDKKLLEDKVAIKMEVDSEFEDKPEEEEVDNQRVVYMDGDSPAQHIFALNQKEQLVCVAEEELLHIQLPTVIPQFEAKKEEEVKKEEEEEVKSTDEEAKALEASMAQLNFNELPEGQIGKLLIYKSGKMKLKIGSILLDIQQGTQSTFLENIMVIDHESEDSKKAIELGHIVQKFVCAPNMDTLLQAEEASLI